MPPSGQSGHMFGGGAANPCKSPLQGNRAADVPVYSR